ncbi:hypothetical protein EDB89DRAFT_1973232, partial [Lactarius sanguifluus]
MAHRRQSSALITLVVATGASSTIVDGSALHSFIACYGHPELAVHRLYWVSQFETRNERQPRWSLFHVDRAPEILEAMRFHLPHWNMHCTLTNSLDNRPAGPQPGHSLQVGNWSLDAPVDLLRRHPHRNYVRLDDDLHLLRYHSLKHLFVSGSRAKVGVVTWRARNAIISWIHLKLLAVV